MVAAYAATRLPATFAAVAAAFTQAQLRRPDWQPRTLLDVGAGPGVALWAALAVWPGLTNATLLERDPLMIALGRRLGAAAPAAVTVDWRQGDLRHRYVIGEVTGETMSDAAAPTHQRAAKPARGAVAPAAGYDLVTASYVLSELPAAERAILLDRLWAATNGALALIGPGTPIGFAQIRAARAQLIAAGATILAPCPHDGDCPMGAAGPLAAAEARRDRWLVRPTPDDEPNAATVATEDNGANQTTVAQGSREHDARQPAHYDAPDDWCHFAQRLARSRLHRQIKGGDLAYEDEKFSYVIAVRPTNPALAPQTPIGGRIVRHPQLRPGLVALEVCAPGGLERRVITRRDHVAYGQARGLRWGETMT